MFVTTSRFWLGWLALMCVGILLCTRQASKVHTQRNVTEQSFQMRAERDVPEQRKPQRDEGDGIGNGKGTVAMKMLNRDAVLGPQQPNDIECSPTRQRQQDKRNQSRYKNNNNNSNGDDDDGYDDGDDDDDDDDDDEAEVKEKMLNAKLENGVDYDRARRMRWVENVCAFIRRPLVDYIYQQVMDARLRKLQELDIGTRLPSGSSSQSMVNMHPVRSHRRKRQPNAKEEAGATGQKATTARRSRRLALLNLKEKLVEILNNAVDYANALTANEGERVAALDKSLRMLGKQTDKIEGGGRGEHGSSSNSASNAGAFTSSCSCHHQQLLKSSHTLTSKF